MSEVAHTIDEEELRLAVITRLRGGWSHARIRATLPVGPGLILRLSRQIGAAYLKPCGRGRRELQGRPDHDVAYRGWPDVSKSEARKRLSTLKSKQRALYNNLLEYVTV
jgi:hypothetical protein